MILSFTTDVAGQIGVDPRRVKIVSTSNLATVTAAGYLNPKNLGINVIYPTDVIDMVYSYNTTTHVGTYASFVPSISNEVITLVLQVNYGNVLLPVVNANIPMFNLTTGQIKDSGVGFSNAAGPYAVTSPGSMIVGNLAKFSDTNGTVADAGINASRIIIPNISAATFNGMYATPISVLAAPGSGKLIEVKQAYLSLVYGTAQFTAGGVVALQYESTVHGAGTAASSTIAAASITGATASTVFTMTGASSTLVAAATNQPLYLSNATAAFATGDSTFNLIVDYTIISP